MRPPPPYRLRGLPGTYLHACASAYLHAHMHDSAWRIWAWLQAASRPPTSRACGPRLEACTARPRWPAAAVHAKPCSQRFACVCRCIHACIKCMHSPCRQAGRGAEMRNQDNMPTSQNAKRSPPVAGGTLNLCPSVRNLLCRRAGAWRCCRWTEELKRTIKSSRVNATRAVVVGGRVGQGCWLSLALVQGGGGVGWGGESTAGLLRHRGRSSRRARPTGCQTAHTCASTPAHAPPRNSRRCPPPPPHSRRMPSRWRL